VAHLRSVMQRLLAPLAAAQRFTLPPLVVMRVAPH
jgi:hypothetical protein